MFSLVIKLRAQIVWPKFLASVPRSNYVIQAACNPGTALCLPLPQSQHQETPYWMRPRTVLPAL